MRARVEPHISILEVIFLVTLAFLNFILRKEIIYLTRKIQKIINLFFKQILIRKPSKYANMVILPNKSLVSISY